MRWRSSCAIDDKKAAYTCRCFGSSAALSDNRDLLAVDVCPGCDTPFCRLLEGRRICWVGREKAVAVAVVEACLCTGGAGAASFEGSLELFLLLLLFDHREECRRKSCGAVLSQLRLGFRSSGFLFTVGRRCGDGCCPCCWAAWAGGRGGLNVGRMRGRLKQWRSAKADKGQRFLSHYV